MSSPHQPHKQGLHGSSRPTWLATIPNWYSSQNQNATRKEHLNYSRAGSACPLSEPAGSVVMPRRCPCPGQWSVDCRNDVCDLNRLTPSLTLIFFGLATSRKHTRPAARHDHTANHQLLLGQPPPLGTLAACRTTTAVRVRPDYESLDRVSELPARDPRESRSLDAISSGSVSSGSVAVSATPSTIL